MYLFQRILAFFHRRFHPKRSFHVDFQTLESLRLIAESEQSTPEQVAEQMLAEGLQRAEQHQEILALWTGLTQREQEVTALLCLRYTNRQIAARLHISPETVKTHVGHILMKFNVKNRVALSQRLADWDFNEWDEA